MQLKGEPSELAGLVDAFGRLIFIFSKILFFSLAEETDPAPENLLKKKSESATRDRTTKEESGRDDNDAMSFMSSIYQDDDEGAEMSKIGGEEKSGSFFQQDNLADFSPSR